MTTKKALTPTKVSSLNSQNTKHKFKCRQASNRRFGNFNFMLIIAWNTRKIKLQREFASIL
ncbi:hypothetical protein SS13_contig00011-0025 [Streptococcus parauberis]|nr:hypothetical protein SS13_contig00011-0025 [Streptococcus parauberis]